MGWGTKLLAVTVGFLQLTSPALGHGWMADPAARNLASNNPDKMSLNAGGIGSTLGGRAWQGGRGSRYGVCGDPDGKRDHEIGGRWSNGGKSQRTYKAGDTISVRLELTAPHKGAHGFRVCPTADGGVSKGCFEAHKLKTNGADLVWVPEGQKQVTFQVKLPPDVSGRAVLQWYWIVANSCDLKGFPGGNMGSCDSSPNVEEFWNCADITITGGSGGQKTQQPDPGKDKDKDKDTVKQPQPQAPLAQAPVQAPVIDHAAKRDAARAKLKAQRARDRAAARATAAEQAAASKKTASQKAAADREAALSKAAADRAEVEADAQANRVAALANASSQKAAAAKKAAAEKAAAAASKKAAAASKKAEAASKRAEAASTKAEAEKAAAEKTGLRTVKPIPTLPSRNTNVDLTRVAPLPVLYRNDTRAQPKQQQQPQKPEQQQSDAPVLRTPPPPAAAATPPPPPAAAATPPPPPSPKIAELGSIWPGMAAAGATALATFGIAMSLKAGPLMSSVFAALLGATMASVLLWLRDRKRKEGLAAAEDEDAWWERLPSPPTNKVPATPRRVQRMALAGIAAEVASEYLLPSMAQPAMRGVRRAMAL